MKTTHDKDLKDLCVLYVDDDELMLELISQQFRFLKIDNFYLAQTVQAADEIFEQQGSNIDVALVDLYMPEINGIGFLKHLRDLNFRGSVGFISGAREFAIAAAERMARHNHLNLLGSLRKPFKVEALEAFLSSSLTAR